MRLGRGPNYCQGVIRDPGPLRIGARGTLEICLCVANVYIVLHTTGGFARHQR